MYYDDLANSIHFNLINLDHLLFDEERSYAEVISPFTRLYLVTKGGGWIKTEGERIILEPGYMYLIPSLRSCTYHFEQGMFHAYAHFSMSLMNGLPVYTLFKTSRKVKADVLTSALFDRLIALNPSLGIPHDNPKVYQTRSWMSKKVEYQSPAQYNETRGILDQLFSRFIIQSQHYTMNNMVKHNLYQVLSYIEENLHTPILIDALASIACLSKDHFIKTFKRTTTQTPGDFINSKRLEKAQMLLLTTDYPIKQIFELVGFSSSAYFSRLFKRYSSYTPTEYRGFRQ